MSTSANPSRRYSSESNASNGAFEGHVQCSFAERLDVVPAKGWIENDLHVGDACAECLEQIVRDRIEPCGGGTHPQDTGLVVRDETRALHSSVDEGQQPIGVLEERLACGRQLHVTLVAHQELRSERALERLDLLGEAGSGDPEAFGGSSEVFLFRDGNEVSQMAKLQRRCPHDVASRAGSRSSFHRHPRADRVARLLLRNAACSASLRRPRMTIDTM